MAYSYLPNQPSIRIIAHHSSPRHCPTLPGCWQEPRARRSTMITTNNGRETDDGQENAETVRTRRKLGVCKGEAHTLMLEEMLKGANVVISGDSGIYLGSCCLTKCFCVLLIANRMRELLLKNGLWRCRHAAFIIP